MSRARSGESESFLTLREAIGRGADLFAAAFNRRYGERALEGYATIFVGFEPKDVLAAAERIARDGGEAPTPAAWMHVTRAVASADGRHFASPWSCPPWAKRIARDPKDQWGSESRYGGFYWLPGEHPHREKRGDAGETYAWDGFGVSRQTGWLMVNPNGYLVWVPLGGKPEEQAGWAPEGQLSAREAWKTVARSVGGNRLARELTAACGDTGVHHVAGAMLQAIGTIAPRGP